MLGRKIPLKRTVEKWEDSEIVSYDVDDTFDIQKEFGSRPRVHLPGHMFTMDRVSGRQNVSGTIVDMDSNNAILTIDRVWEG